MPNPQPNFCLEVDFQNVDKHTGANAAKGRKDNQLQSLKLPCRIS